MSARASAVLALHDRQIVFENFFITQIQNFKNEKRGQRRALG